jgi:hypothetical protein
VDRERREVSALASRLEAKALAALAGVPDYLDLIPARHVRYRLFCLWPAIWAVRSAAPCAARPSIPVGPAAAELPRQVVYGTTLRSLLTAGRGPDLRGELKLAMGARTAAGRL